MLPLFDIAIDKLRIEAAGKEATRIANDLQNGGWSVGDNADWLFIRELNVVSQKNGLRLNASREIKNEIARAVYGGSSQAASANAVRFSSLPDVLAFLLADIVRGRQLWFWQKWLHLFKVPKSEAITQLLWENMTEFAAVIERLSELQALPEVWRHLSVSQAQILLTRLAELQGISAQRLLTPVYELESLFTHDQDIAQIFLKQYPSKSLWRKIYPAPSQPDAKSYLAAIAVGIATVPQAVARRPESVISAFHQVILAANPSSDADHVEKRLVTSLREHKLSSMPKQNNLVLVQENLQQMPDEVSQSAMVEIKNGDAQQDFARAVHPAVANLESTAAGQPATGGTATETHSESAIASKQINSSQNSAQALEQDAPGEKFPLEMAVAETEFYTRFGGIFYLINAVNHPESYALLRDIRAWHELASGWTLIYGLAKQLTHQIDRPLLQFFADVCGFTSIAQLERVKHPELVELLFPCLQQRYENHLQWNEKLLALPARVVSTYSDINVFCDMSAIRLPVRLSGLDVNPGWIPWLGRVIRFHYREELALKLSGEHE